MHVWQWLLTGVIAGLLARLALRHSTIGLGGDLALGALGGLATGALLHYGGLIRGGTVTHVVVALLGAIGVIASMHGIARIVVGAGRYLVVTTKLGDVMANLSHAGPIERGVVQKFLERKPVSRDVEREQEESETLGQRTADAVARFGGSWAFIGLFTAVLVTWMLFNVEDTTPFDPFPFILLNLVLSCLAAVQAPIILMSQNRQAEKDRVHAQADYAVNLKAEMEILSLHTKLDGLREQAWRELLDKQEHQIAMLQQLLAAKISSAGQGLDGTDQFTGPGDDGNAARHR